MWKIFKRYGCQSTPISKPIRLMRRERNVVARAAINIGNTAEETVNVNETNPVPVEETKPAKHTKKVNSIRSFDISITTSADEVDEATKL